MKLVYNFVLTLLTIAMLGLLTFSKLNEAVNWVDLSEYKTIIKYIAEFGPMVLLCLFAFGGLIGKVLLSKIFFVIILILLIVFTISMFAPNWVTAIMGGSGNAAIFKI